MNTKTPAGPAGSQKVSSGAGQAVLKIRDLAKGATFTATGRLSERAAVTQERDVRATQDLI